MKLKKVQETCDLVDIDFSNLAGESMRGFSQDMLKSVVNSVFTRVVELKNGHSQKKDIRGLVISSQGKIEIQQQAFETAIQDLRNQGGVGKINYLTKPRETVSESVLHAGVTHLLKVSSRSIR